MTKKLMVGKVAVGGGAPVSIQSMCNTKTDDVAATVAQIHALEDAGCEIIRVAVPDEDAAKAVDKIKEQIDISLIADIHFNYKLALMCAERGIDALRINPGNIGSFVIFQTGSGRFAVCTKKCIDKCFGSVQTYIIYRCTSIICHIIHPDIFYV